MSARNATYDVLWGVPDGEGLNCSSASDPQPFLPVCTNTSFPGYPGSWTMWNARRPGQLSGGGLTSATAYNTSEYGQFASPFAVWTAEIAFPIRRGAGHGGLLDAGPPLSPDAFDAYDPSRVPQVYWHFDLARAEHPSEWH